MASIITWNGLSEFLTLLNAVANEPCPYKSGSVWYPHDEDGSIIEPLPEAGARLPGRYSRETGSDCAW
jgi:hypothetical protein